MHLRVKCYKNKGYSNFNKQFIFQSRNTIWKYSIFGIYYCLKIINATVDFKNEERSQRGMALLSHTYKSFSTEEYNNCLMACMQDPKCTSLNYGWYTSQCDLNNKTKYSAEAKFFSQDAFSTYMGLIREPGIRKNFCF